jgi:hypothetical protein
VIEVQGRHLAPTERAAGEQPPVTGDDPAVMIDQDRDVEAERFDTIRDLLDLLFAVDPRVLGVWLKFFDRSVDEV